MKINKILLSMLSLSALYCMDQNNTQQDSQRRGTQAVNPNGSIQQQQQMFQSMQPPSNAVQRNMYASHQFQQQAPYNMNQPHSHIQMGASYSGNVQQQQQQHIKDNFDMFASRALQPSNSQITQSTVQLRTFTFEEAEQNLLQSMSDVTQIIREQRANHREAQELQNKLIQMQSVLEGAKDMLAQAINGRKKAADLHKKAAEDRDSAEGAQNCLDFIAEEIGDRIKTALDNLFAGIVEDQDFLNGLFDNRMQIHSKDDARRIVLGDREIINVTQNELMQIMQCDGVFKSRGAYVISRLMLEKNLQAAETNSANSQAALVRAGQQETEAKNRLTKLTQEYNFLESTLNTLRQQQ